MKQKFLGATLGAVLVATVFYSSTSASAAASFNNKKVVNDQKEEVRPQAVGKWVLAGGKFVAKQFTSAWAADQWGTASSKKEYVLNKDELEVLFDQ
ncbi:hypothetical protein [Bacillus tequilensis]|uniref:Uncharacterized protein n=1 Tax=Bacillus tequilensis TaxID=227866 RepID=A0A6H0WR29_9BACI|nr:hypothetical protein [Bacillus tequilensis]QIW81947.1 hypothetical protein G4P54_20235 [Bacillus tequilensis]